MRAVLPLEVLVSAALLSAACNSTTGPEPTLPGDPGIAVLTVAPSFATIEGQPFLKLTATLSGSAAGVPASQVRWASSDTNVATVSSGLVEARKAGRVQIAATWSTAHGSATVVILNPVGKKPTFPEPPKCLQRRAERSFAIPVPC